MSEMIVRKATVKDAALILKFINALAAYEKAEREVIATVEDLEKNIFGSNSTTHVIICSIDDVPIGLAVYFLNFSTWLGKNGLYLEDLYISPEYRGAGAGKRLLKHLAQLAVDKNYGRFEWSVLDWNQPAIKFYESIGAKAQSEWIGYRLDGQSLLDFAKS